MNKILATLIGLFLFSHYGNAQATISTPPKNGGWYKIKVVQSGKYLAVDGSSDANGAKIVLWDYMNRSNQKFLVQKNNDGTYSFFAGHSNKTICADKGDNREGDLIIQNTLSQYFGKWHLAWVNNCGQGFKIQYKSGGGRPIQLTGLDNGAACQLIEPQYHDGDTDCPYLFLFEAVDAPVPKTEKPISSEIQKKPQTIKKNGN